MTTLAANPASPVPLDTIPISPADGVNGDNRQEDVHADSNDGDLITVFHDPENFNVKHPLAHTWTFWFTKPPSGRVCCLCDFQLKQSSVLTHQGDNWNELLKEVISFDSVEEFWGIYVSSPSESQRAKLSY